MLATYASQYGDISHERQYARHSCFDCYIERILHEMMAMKYDAALNEEMSEFKALLPRVASYRSHWRSLRHWGDERR